MAYEKPRLILKSTVLGIIMRQWEISNRQNIGFAIRKPGYLCNARRY